MYRVQRKDDDVTISGINGNIVCVIRQDSYVVSREGTALKCTQVKALNDSDLILALANAVKILPDTED